MENINENKPKFIKPILEGVKEAFIKHIIIFFIFFGVLLLIVSLIEFSDIKLNEKVIVNGVKIQALLMTMGTITLSSGAFSAITKSKAFLEIFTNTLQEIVYQEKFLKNQKNIDSIWDRVTKSICDQNFDGLSEKIFNNIKNNYLPIKNDFYYEEFEINIVISFNNENPKYLDVKETTTCIINTKNKADDYEFKSGVNIEANNPEQTSIDILRVNINGIDEDVKKSITQESVNTILKTHGLFKLKDKSSYKIIREEFKSYNYEINPNRIHTATKLYKDMKISVHYPKDLHVEFMELGTTNKWKKSGINDLNGVNWFSVHSNNIIFINQGYLLNFRKKN